MSATQEQPQTNGTVVHGRTCVVCDQPASVLVNDLTEKPPVVNEQQGTIQIFWHVTKQTWFCSAHKRPSQKTYLYTKPPGEADDAR